MENVLVDQKFGRTLEEENFVNDQTQREIKILYGQNDDNSKRVLKRAFDLFVSFFTLIFVVSWLFPIIAILIKLDSKGSVFFKQLRHGRDNELFYCYKFRSKLLLMIQGLLGLVSS